MAHKINFVAEMQGLYGPFTITERVVQKIWLRGDFDRSRLQLADGRPLEIRTAGVWNLLGGPDFRGAQLVMAGRAVTGDIEVHFHAADWRAHGHQADRAYDRVALHVVMFPPTPNEAPAVRGDGCEIPTLVLLPWLHRDLEEYASDDALEAITARDEWEQVAELAAMPPGHLGHLLRRMAYNRWRQKLRFAKLRLDRLGWTAAAHHTALEILGYRANRPAMLTVAARYPLTMWAGSVDLAEIFATEDVAWQTQGVRPANHPLRRLRQYQAWTRACPDWPGHLLVMAAGWPTGWDDTDQTRLVRQNQGLKARRETIAGELLGGAVSGARLDNLVCDGFLPLVTGWTGKDLFSTWFHWYLGDMPAQVGRALPRLGVAGRGAAPLCQGWAQGLLGWILDHEARASH